MVFGQISIPMLIKLAQVSQFFTGFKIPEIYINQMRAVQSSLIKNFYNKLLYSASFYKTALFFEQLQATSGSLDKESVINKFRLDLESQDLQQFDKLMVHINKKIKIRFTSKLAQNYYMKSRVSESDHEDVEKQIIQKGISQIVCPGDQQSELTLYDINTFLLYIAGVKGQGSQTEKSNKVIELLSKISKKQGKYLVQILDHKLTIGARGKSFQKAKLIKNDVQQ